MNSLAKAFEKLQDDPSLGDMVKVAQARAEKAKGRPSEQKEQREALQDELDRKRALYESGLRRALKDELPGFTSISLPDLIPGARLLHGKLPCLLKGCVRDIKGKLVWAIVCYEQPQLIPTVEGRSSTWAQVLVEEVKPRAAK